MKAFGAIAILFLLVSFGGHTPFYRLWYVAMPMMDKVRAPGMAFMLVALPVAVFAGFGADRLFRRDVSLRSLLVPLGVLAGLALLGVAGVLEGVGMALVAPEQAARVAENAGPLRTGALRLLAVTVVGGAVLWAIGVGRLRGALAGAALAVVVVADLWSVDRLFFEYREPAAVIFADDAITSRIRSEKNPFRVLDVGVYQGSYLMAHRIMTMLGYHGFEIRYYDELLGGKNQWRNAGSPNLHDLLAVRYLLLPENQAVPGFHHVAGAGDDDAGLDRRAPRARYGAAVRPDRSRSGQASGRSGRGHGGGLAVSAELGGDSARHRVGYPRLAAYAGGFHKGEGHARRMGAREDAGDSRGQRATFHLPVDRRELVSRLARAGGWKGRPGASG